MGKRLKTLAQVVKAQGVKTDLKKLWVLRGEAKYISFMDSKYDFLMDRGVSGALVFTDRVEALAVAVECNKAEACLQAANPDYRRTEVTVRSVADHAELCYKWDGSKRRFDVSILEGTGGGCTFKDVVAAELKEIKAALRSTDHDLRIMEEEWESLDDQRRALEDLKSEIAASRRPPPTGKRKGKKAKTKRK